MGVELRHLHGGNFQMGKAGKFGRVRFRVVRFSCGGGLGPVWRLRRCRKAIPAPASAGAGSARGQACLNANGCRGESAAGKTGGAGGQVLGRDDGEMGSGVSWRKVKKL